MPPAASSPRGVHTVKRKPPVCLVLGTETLHQLHLQYDTWRPPGTPWEWGIAAWDSVHLTLAPIAAPIGWSDFSSFSRRLTGVPTSASPITPALNARFASRMRTWRSLSRPIALLPNTDGCCETLGRVLPSGYRPHGHRHGHLDLPAETCLEFEVHRDQLSGYESSWPTARPPWTLLTLLGTDTPFLSAPSEGVVTRTPVHRQP